MYHVFSFFLLSLVYNGLTVIKNALTHMKFNNYNMVFLTTTGSMTVVS